MARTLADRQDVIPVLAEVFRDHGFEGASLSAITARTGLGKGSLYNFFPGGKAEMAEVVLAHIDGWFRAHVFEPLEQAEGGLKAVEAMFQATDAYFRSGQRVCVVGVFALGDARDLFTEQVHGYFAAWVRALAAALVRAGRDPDQAQADAEEVVAGIQGALVLSRALSDTGVFTRTLARLRRILADD
ncbi:MULTISPECIES: TetR/AcrR family transcriptional regulator [Nitrospirillum]|uniref:TetR family transcriptional regulator n=1 Tax=Nitrospirillum amazonense TaxID=28077 RepID=A0A560FUN1_9PROT|nr:TetR/AcrR family transcriptional regulator [Nitrospirillum amazonense]MEC4592596.1 TetR/AcrR family transcriptional regulator [Nitrospirillum amazonense]TWB25346.1 TetR family transcriptional regulator [Nitrospirillum amazonense]